MGNGGTNNFFSAIAFWLAEVRLSDASYISSAVPIRIFIRDSNDNSPEFDEQYYEFGVLENSGVGTFVGKVLASDKDSGNYGSDGIRYTHLGGSISHL